MQKSWVLVGLGAMAAVTAGATGIAVGQDVIAQRKDLMKQIGGAAKTSNEMIKGEKPYDAKAAEGAASTIAKNWAAFSKHFPDSSKTGGETKASAKVWQQKADFEARLARGVEQAEAAAAAAPKGMDAFKASFGEVAKNCKSCHDEYWVPKK